MTIHLIVGPVGAGKSTFARTLRAQHRAVLLVLDDWMARLYGADERPEMGRIEWYLERRDRCLEQIRAVTSDVCEQGGSVVLEIGLVRRAEREAFYRWVEDEARTLEVHLIDAPREVRRERVMQRNRERGETFAQEVPLPFFELASDMWQAPDDDEIRQRGIVVHPQT